MAVYPKMPTTAYFLLHFANQKNVNKHKDGDDEFIVAKGHVYVGLVGLVGLVGRTYGFVLVGTLWSRVGRWSPWCLSLPVVVAPHTSAFRPQSLVLNPS